MSESAMRVRCLTPLIQLNLERRSQGLPPLSLSEWEQELAEGFSALMDQTPQPVETDSFGHSLATLQAIASLCGQPVPTSLPNESWDTSSSTD